MTWPPLSTQCESAQFHLGVRFSGETIGLFYKVTITQGKAVVHSVGPGESGSLSSLWGLSFCLSHWIQIAVCSKGGPS